MLTVSQTAELDCYDVANALVQILVSGARIDDALVLESILSTPLMALRKRGYNVDRILNQQREERLRLETEAETARRAAVEAKAREAKIATPTTSSKGAVDPPPYAGSTAGSSGADQAGQGQNKFWNQPGSIMDMVRSRMGQRSASSSGPSAIEAESSSSGGTQPTPSKPHAHGADAAGGSGGGAGAVGGKSTERPTSLNDIRSTVLKAVNASRSETQAQFQSQKSTIKNVAESQQHYCDDTAEANLWLGGLTALRVQLTLSTAWKPSPNDIAACKIWLPHGQEEFKPDQVEVGQRFSRKILAPLANVFNVG
jgi:hypothetical protein